MTHTADHPTAARSRLLRRLLVPAAAAAVAVGSLAAPTGAAASPQAPDPDRFSTTIDNPFMPMVPGTVFRYRESADEGKGRVVVRVTDRTKQIQGIETVVVRARSFLGGKLVEDTFDWYAQDRRGNVWYFGENTKSYENGRWTTAGSWKAGRDGARAGILMKAHPAVGDSYYQEMAPGVAEAKATVLSRQASATVPYGSFDHLLKTKDVSALSPGEVEHKLYARGIGPVREKFVRGGDDVITLVKVVRP